MPIREFKVEASLQFTSQPNPAGEKIIFRSSNAADVSPLSLVLSGLVAATPSAETKAFSTVDGRIEVETTAAFETLSSCQTSAAPAGSVGVYGQGTKASGYISLPSGAPVAGDTISIGLNGFEKDYTWRAGAQWTVVCGNVASLAQGDYFDLTFGGTTHRFWFDKDNAGTGAPADPGALHEVDITTGGTASDVATAVQAAIDALTNIKATVNTATVTVTAEALGTMTLADGAGGAATGFTLTSVTAGTAATGDGDVVIGTDRFQTIRNLAHAINALTDSGTYYGSATTANAYGIAYDSGSWADTTFDGTSNATIYLRDRLACSRQLAWVVDATTADFSTAAPTGGADGQLLATLDSSAYSVSEEMNFNNPTLDTGLANNAGLLLAGTTPISDPLYIGGVWSTLRVLTSNNPQPVTFIFEISDDGVTWDELSNNWDTADNNDQSLIVAPCEYLRWKVTVNANTTDVPFHVVAILA